MLETDTVDAAAFLSNQKRKTLRNTLNLQLGHFYPPNVPYLVADEGLRSKDLILGL